MDISRITEDHELCKRSIESGIFQIEQFRICRFSRLISDYIVNASGDVDLKKAKEVLNGFKIKAYGEFDAIFSDHVKQIIELFFQKKIQIKLRQLSLPLANNWVEEIIRVAVSNSGSLDKRHISVALIGALLTFLRQSVGSCFATAPIILMQTNDPEFLFNDLCELIMRGSLKRVIDGAEYKVPISIKTSVNLDFESPLLRTYEYTVASFADWKTESYKWNLFSALGLDAKEEGGLGKAIYSLLEEKLDAVNKDISRLDEDLYLSEVRYSKNGAISERTQMTIFASELKEKRTYGEKIAGFFPFFVDELLKASLSHFQEVFDPSMSQDNSEILEDSPAGFRLVFKHGRSDPTVWTMIYNENQYRVALIDFFKQIEPDLIYKAAFPEAKKFISEVIDKVIQTIQGMQFLLKDKEPWAYISGGNLESLVSCYYLLKNPLVKKDFFSETPLDLCAALIDYMKDLPYEISRQFEENPVKGILMTNKVHAFIFKPGLKSFSDAWHDSGNTYTYIRDNPGIISFADTNWGSDLFAFAHEPQTNEIKLYRKSTFGLKLLPKVWDTYFDKTAAWTLWHYSN